MEGGYVLLLSILVASILLAVSFGVFLIGLRELRLASFLHDSQRALAAADTGVECALYWDRAFPYNGMDYSIFATTTGSVIPGNASDVECDNVTLPSDPVADWNVTSLIGSGLTTFTLPIEATLCANVSVTKSDIDTVVRGDGSSTCDPNNPYSTQRSIEVSSNIGAAQPIGGGLSCTDTVIVSDMVTTVGSVNPIPATEVPNAGWVNLVSAKWIWEPTANPIVPRIFHRQFGFPQNADVASIEIAADNTFLFYVNSVLVGTDVTGNTYSAPVTFDIRPYLSAGEVNQLRIEVTNAGGPGGLAYRLTLDCP